MRYHRATGGCDRGDSIARERRARGADSGVSRLSVIVPAHGHPAQLRACLAALRAADVPGTELIVVDDASPEDMSRVAEESGARLLRLAENVGPAAARNAGARHARAPLLLFIDADVVVRPDTLGHVLEAFAAHPEVAAVFGSYDDDPPAPGLVSQYRNLLHHFVHQRGDPEASTFWAGCGGIRRAAFEEVGGFDARRYRHPSVEDIELGYRLRRAGQRIRLDPTLQVTHLKQWTLVSMLRTDILRRAAPWARLVLEGNPVANDLNLSHAQRVSAVLAAVAALAVPAAGARVEMLGVAATALLAMGVLNRSLFGFFRRRRGLAFAAACLPLQILHYLCSLATFAVVWLDVRILHLRGAGSSSVSPAEMA
jgi:molybdopterin-guanine dinucleotide biosynthesis protein A